MRTKVIVTQEPNTYPTMEALREHAQDHFTSFLTRLADSFESKSADAFIDLFLPSGWLREYVLLGYLPKS